MISAGAPVTLVQKMLGHTSIRTTQINVQVADTQVEQDYHTGIQKVIDNYRLRFFFRKPTNE
jgi:site-specific recombinase XerD